MLLEIYALFMPLTLHDWCELLCCSIITCALLQCIYTKYGPAWYTLSYWYIFCIATSWLLSYKIISVITGIGGIAATLIFLPRVSGHDISPSPLPHLENNSWLENIIALSIQGFHEDISLTWIIDYNGHLNNILYAEIPLQVYTVPKLNTIIFHTIDQNTRTSTLWLNHHGYIIGINPHKGLTNSIPSADDMLAWSARKGAIVLQSHAPKRHYSIMHKGIIKDNLSSHHAYHLMKNLLVPQQSTQLQESL